MAPRPSEWCSRSIIQSLARYTARRLMAFENRLRSHHLSIRSNVRKALCHVNQERYQRKAGLTPGSQISSRLKPAGTGRRGLAACAMASDTAMARVHADIWYRKSNGSSTTSGGMLGQYCRGYKSNRLRLTLT